MLTIPCKFPEVESIAGAPGVLPTPFAAMHGLPSPLAGPYNGVPPAGGLASLGGFPLGAAGLGVRVPTNAQTSAVLLVSNLNEEVSATGSVVRRIVAERTRRGHDHPRWKHEERSMRFALNYGPFCQFLGNNW